jgi:hypothetical protein
LLGLSRILHRNLEFHGIFDPHRSAYALELRACQRSPHRDSRLLKRWRSTDCLQKLAIAPIILPYSDAVEIGQGEANGEVGLDPIFPRALHHFVQRAQRFEDQPVLRESHTPWVERKKNKGEGEITPTPTHFSTLSDGFRRAAAKEKFAMSPETRRKAWREQTVKCANYEEIPSFVADLQSSA